MDNNVKKAVASSVVGLSLLGIGVGVFNNVEQEPTTVHAQSNTSYTVVRGDTLYSIANRHNVSLNSLLSVNGLSTNSLILPGQTISIPSGSTNTEPNSTSVSRQGGYWNGLTNDQYQVLLAVVQQESGVHEAGAFAVATTITNRIDEGFANTAYGVITQAGQFESYTAGHYKKHLGNIHPTVKRQVDRALNGEKSHNYLYFWSDWYARQQGRSGQNIGGNVFFRNY